MARETFDSLKAHPGRHQPQTLDPFFDTLEPVTVEAMLGPWEGGVFRTGSLWEKPLGLPLVHWHGKRFESPDRVHALVGRFLGLRFNFPLGAAVLRPVAFRGKTSAAMIYDRLPIIDHFRKIDDEAVMGIMDHKGRIEVYFYLERETVS
jgi:hypothetical protein